MTPKYLIDIHQHLNFMNSSDEELISHQKNIGASKTILLPASEKISLDNGLLANVPNTEIAYNFCKENKSFLFAANFSPDKLYMIEEYINKGAKINRRNKI